MRSHLKALNLPPLLPPPVHPAHLPGCSGPSMAGSFPGSTGGTLIEAGAITTNSMVLTVTRSEGSCAGTYTVSSHGIHAQVLARFRYIF